MPKIIRWAIFFLAFLLKTNLLAAKSTAPSYYLGFEPQYAKFGFSKDFKHLYPEQGVEKKSTILGIAGIIGIRYTQRIGFEMGYSVFSRSKTSATNATIEFRPHNVYGMAMGYQKFNENIDLLGGAGIGWFNARLTSRIRGKSNGQYSDNTFRLGFKVSAGLQWFVNKEFSSRLMFHHHSGGKFIQHSKTVGISVLYHLR